MRLSMLMRRVLVPFFFPLLLIACAHHEFYVNDIELQQKLLPFLEDGKTTKEEVESKLDRRGFQYEEGRIWTYIMLLTEQGPLEVRGTFNLRGSGYYSAQYHLVLVFDEKNILKRHSLLRFKP